MVFIYTFDNNINNIMTIENKKDMIAMLAKQLLLLKQNEYKDYQIVDDKPEAYYDAMVDILKENVKKAELGAAKLFKIDKLEKDRTNLSDEEKRKLIETQKRNSEVTDSYLATMEPRCSLKGKIRGPDNIILRYRGHKINDDFNKKYPLGVLM